MKKLAILAALASLGAAAAVESSNTVGYYTKSIANGKFGQLAVQFEAVGGGNAKVTDLFKTEDLVAVAAEFDTVSGAVTTESQIAAPQIQVWDGNDYTIYYYFSNAWDNETQTEVSGWADAAFAVLLGDDNTLPPGQGVWVKATTSAANVIQAGQVYDGSYTKSAAKGKFVMICNTLPEALDVNNASQISFASITGVEAEFDTVSGAVTTESQIAAPQIQVWDGNDYTIYYYFSNAWDNETQTEVSGWADAAFAVLLGDESLIPAGQAFWLKSKTGAVTVNINE